MDRTKWINLIITVFLLCLGPVNYFNLQHTDPRDLQNAALTYTGKCVDAYTDVKYAYKSTRLKYLFRMEDGREFWLDGIYSQQGDFDFSHFCDTVPGSTITVRYIDVNYSLGSFAKEAVEVQVGDQVFLSMEDVEYTRRYTKGYFWFGFLGWTLLIAGFELWDLWDNRRVIRQRWQRKRNKARRRAWIETHPEEKGAPPAPGAKRTAAERRGTMIAGEHHG